MSLGVVLWLDSPKSEPIRFPAEGTLKRISRTLRPKFKKRILRIWNLGHDLQMRLATREQVFTIDQKALEEFQLSSEELVARAGRALFAALEKVIKTKKINAKSKIGVWCGPGHNGADGRVVAEWLKKKKYSVHVLEGVAWNPQSYDILIDAYFGVGLNRDIEGELQEQIQKINQAKRLVFAIDIPSGLDANRGVVLGEAIKAQWTLTVAPAKPGLFLNEGPKFAGKIRCVSLELPESLLQNYANNLFLVGAPSARRLLPSRSLSANKSNFGHLLVVAGSSGMDGAPSLVCEAAARMGCGYVTLCSRSQELSKFSRPDFLRLSLESFFKSDLKKYSAVVVGPGLGNDEETSKILHYLQENHSKVLVDADALTALSKYNKVSLPANWILTPHAGELSRLLKTPAKDLERDRLSSVDRAVRETGAHILFKGFRTVLGSKGKTYIIGAGNVALAKAGSGDVLAGFIGSLMAQGLPTLNAGVLGAYLHGRVADDWLRRGHSSRTLMASDIPDLLDASLRSLKNSF